MPVELNFMQFQEVVEAQGHLIDSHVMEQIFDQVVEFGGRFEVEEFRVGRNARFIDGCAPIVNEIFFPKFI